RAVANRVVFMADGEIVEEAPPDEFFSAPKRRRTQAFLGQLLKH
ncbi:MAG: glutamine ABC transporter ATP-binding protein GlnQ, partial [Acidisphaera sp.]|nr:glutamine ABC transporter ATP-binding protein GlnQ [Acidisphaera sp.]